MAKDIEYRSNDSPNPTGEPVMGKVLSGHSKALMGAGSDYRSLMKSILLIGIIVPLVPMILASGAIYYQFHVSFKKEIHGHLFKIVNKGKSDIDDFMNSNPDDIDYKALNQALARVGIAEAGSFFITDRDGRYQAGAIQNVKPEEGVSAGLLDTIEIAGDEIAIVQGTDDSGSENIYGITKLKGDDRLLIYQEKVSEAFSTLDRAKAVGLAVILIVGCLIAINAIRLSKMMVQRITQADREKQKLNEQMFQTGKLASIGELAAGVAHEINNPVAIMVEEAGWINDLLEDEQFHDSKNLKEFKRSLEQIQSQGKRCREITHKLLSFARKTDTRVKDIEVNALIEDAITIFTKRAEYEGVAIHTDIQENLPVIEGSQTEIQQVLINLISNAIDATEKKGGTISISAELERHRIVISVSDNGSGISKEHLSRIFDPFFTTKPFGKGTGLGLAICYGIIRQLGGEIEVESTIDKGSTFRVAIPIPKNRGDVSLDIDPIAGTHPSD